MRPLIFILCLMGAVGTARAEEDHDPFATEKPLRSPLGTFTIFQVRDPDGNFGTRIHFAKDTHPDLVLEPECPWSALFYVSPDDRWILQIQKVGSGDNVSYLHHLDARGHLHTERRLNEHAFGYLKGLLGVSEKDLFHTGAEFQSWDMRAGLLKFTLHGSSVQKSSEGLKQEIIYDFREDRFQVPRKAARPSPNPN